MEFKLESLLYDISTLLIYLIFFLTKIRNETKYTIARKGDLRKELERVRARGFATNNEELSLGLRSVAAPVRNFTGEVIGAVNIAVPSIRVSVRRLETVLSKKVVETANKISYVLGYHEQMDLTFQGKFQRSKQKRRGSSEKGEYYGFERKGPFM